MIITSTPFRIPLGGGGTDLPAFYTKHGGFLFSVAIDKYMYVTLNKLAAENVIRITHAESEVANTVEEIKHELAREALKYMGEVGMGLEVASFADLPPGSGMGSSGSYLVGLLRALHELQNKKISSQDLAELAFHIEIDILKKPVGKQDQYLAAFGGFVGMDISRNGKVNVITPNFTPEFALDLNKKSLMFYTFKRHDTVKILKEQSQRAAQPGGDTEKAMLKIKDIGKQLFSEFEAGQLGNFGKLMHEHWLAKKTISTQMSDPWLDEIYDLALQSGAEGGKIMGSGGGGCFLFFVPAQQEIFIKKMEEAGLKHLPYSFAPSGSGAILRT